MGSPEFIRCSQTRYHRQKNSCKSSCLLTTAPFARPERTLLKTSIAALQPTPNHLRQQERSLQDRSRGESPGKSAKKPAGLRRIVEPPEIRNEPEMIHVNMLGVDEFQQPGAAMRSAKSALLHAAPGGLRDSMTVESLVYHDRPRVDALGDSLSAREVAGPDAGRQTVNAVVCQANRVVVRLECHDGKHRAEGFFSHHVHLVVYIRQHRRFKARPRRSRYSLSAGQRNCPSRRGFVYMSLDRS